MDLGAIAFYVVAAVSLIAALGVVLTRNVVYSALLLILSLSLTGLIYLLLLADFLALVQILIYGGTVSVLLLFALMLTRPQESAPLNRGGWHVGVIGALLLFGALAYGTLWTDWGAAATATAGGGRAATVPDPVRVSIDQLGESLFTTWAVPFEIASLVLLVALLGALQVARSAEGPREGAR
jgi:NADH-quinone oxidoreductase subunit J